MAARPLPVRSHGTVLIHVELLENRDTPTFVGLAPYDFTTPPAAVIFAAGDFNGDGRADVAIGSNATPGGVQIHLGNGDGQFTPGQNLPGQFNEPVRAILVYDANNDGNLDLAVGTGLTSTGNLQVYLGNGAGTFALQFVDQGFTRAVGSADFDGDGNADLATIAFGGYRVFQGDGTGNYPVAANLPAGMNFPIGNRIVTADFDADGSPDFASLTQSISSVGFQVNYFDGQGFTPGITNIPGINPDLGVQPDDILAGDFTGDGLPDVVTAFNGTVRLHANLGNRTFDPAGVTLLTGLPTRVRLTSTDFDSNGSPDLAVLDRAGRVQVLYFNANGSFSPDTGNPYTPNPVAQAKDIAAADFNGDGVPDFAELYDAVAGLPDPIMVFLGTRRPTIVPAGSDNGPVVCLFSSIPALRGGVDVSATGFTGVRPSVGDFNRDGIPDVLFGSAPGTPSGVALLDTATRTVHTLVNPFEPSFTGGVLVAAGDIDGDGFADAAVAPDMGGGPRVQVYLTRGGNLVRIADFMGLEDPNFRGGVRVALGDVNGDGFADLVVTAGPGGGPRVAVYDGFALAAGNVQRLVNDFFAFDPSSRIGAFAAVGDINRDGFAEIVLGADAGGGPRVQVYDGQNLIGGTRQVLADFLAGPASARGGIRVAVEDFNLDGFGDVVTGPGGQDGSQQRIFDGAAISTGGVALLLERFPFPGLNSGIYVA